MCTDESYLCAQMSPLPVFGALNQNAKLPDGMAGVSQFLNKNDQKCSQYTHPCLFFFPGAFGRPNVPQDRGIRWCRSCGRCASLGRVGRPRHAHAPQPTPPSIDSIVVFPSAGLGTSYESPQGKAYYLSIYCI